MKSLKDKVSNYLAIAIAIATVVSTAIDAVPIESEWYVWVGAALFAIFGWLTGKSGNLKDSAQ